MFDEARPDGRLFYFTPTICRISLQYYVKYPLPTTVFTDEGIYDLKQDDKQHILPDTLVLHAYYKDLDGLWYYPEIYHEDIVQNIFKIME